MSYIIALVAGALFNNTRWAAFIIEHTFSLALLAAVTTTMVAGLRRPGAKRRPPAAPGPPLPPRRKARHTGRWS
jgi:hypothetical protein